MAFTNKDCITFAVQVAVFIGENGRQANVASLLDT